MAVAQGYGKIVTSGSVFAYDVGDTRNSYKGEPTENLSATMASAIGGNTSLSYPQTVYISTALETNVTDPSAPGGQYSRFTGNTESSNNQLYTTFNSAGIDVRNTTITYSVYLKGSGTCHLTIYADNTGYGTSPTITLTDQWTRYSYTRAVTNYTTNCWVAVRGLNTTTNVYVAAQQSELKSHATPFVNGTRSATQGLIDLTGNSTIDLSNVSFDSNAQMTFDGSDDRILTSENITLNGSQTFEVITTISGGPQSPAGIISNHDYANTSNFGLNHISSNRIGISIGYTNNTREYDSKYTTYAATVGTPFHLVMTFDQPSNTVKLYVNSALDSTFVLTKTVKFTNRPIVLGRWDYQYNYYYFNGKVPAAKVYTRALSAAEVKQNYLHYKTRFNLS